MLMLDIDRFAKIRRLHDSTTNAGEKASAASRMRTLAGKAGLTVEQALSKLDAAAAKQTHDAFTGSPFANAWADFMNSPEQRAFDVKRAAEQEAKRQEAIAEHGSQDAVFAESPWELRLRRACEPLIERHPVHGYVSKLDGWEGWSREMPASVRAAVTTAYRLPQTVAEAWGEVRHWEESHDQRCAFDRDYSPWHWVRARQQIAEDLCDTLPAAGMEDLQARVEWLRHVNNLGWSRDVHEDNLLIDRLAGDVAYMAGVVSALACLVERVSHTVQNGRTNRMSRTERRGAIRTLLAGGHSDREIARKLGVSPSTVGSIRRGQNGN